ncbi:ribosome assembly cofactor RimP [Eudoraea chungangensis]|uniref:ribosome assembly cofactor RimP n=1 Tax=Eudoraea chungangensis TaxID=1481905 RepID=UPI0023EC2B7B|nr:ribosome assembly cofactor RimP [Eudoraea chungangensis]
MFKEKVEALLNKALEDRNSLFLIDFTISSNNAIKIVLDGDKGVSLSDCIDVSRAIEHNLDREEVDFALEVTSAGATEPLVIGRQYIKNIGRKLEVKTAEDKFEGNLTEASPETIVLEWKAREKKPIGKGKTTVIKRKEIALNEIKEAKVKLKF